MNCTRSAEALKCDWHLCNLFCHITIHCCSMSLCKPDKIFSRLSLRHYFAKLSREIIHLFIGKSFCHHVWCFMFKESRTTYIEWILCIWLVESQYILREEFIPKKIGRLTESAFWLKAPQILKTSFWYQFLTCNRWAVAKSALKRLVNFKSHYFWCSAMLSHVKKALSWLSPVPYSSIQFGNC